MPTTTNSNRFAILGEQLCQMIARHGHLRRLAGPLLVLIWTRVRRTAVQVATLMAQMREGQLRRYPARRRSRPTAQRRPVALRALPRGAGWLVTLIPETAGSAGQLQFLLADPEIPALLAAAPQLRRALRPLCRMLGVSLPRPAVPDQADPNQADPDQAALPERDPPPEPPPGRYTRSKPPATARAAISPPPVALAAPRATRRRWRHASGRQQ